jgi:hypothetical protein
MTDEVEPGLSDQYRKASPWPLFVALGFVLSEVGVVLGLFPVTVGGLLLLGGTVAGILREAEYIARPAAALAVLGVVLGAAGLLLVVSQVALADLSLSVLTDRGRPIVYRGSGIATAGAILLGVAGAVWATNA